MRDEILRLLSEREMTVTEISKALGISKATVSHHIERLREDGLVRVLIESFKKSANKRDRAETFRNTVRILGYVPLKTSPYLFRRAGFEVGYALGFEEAKLDDLGDVWENLGLGKVSTSRDSMTVEDCYFCSGLPEVGYAYCLYDEVSGKEIRCQGSEVLGSRRRTVRVRAVRILISEKRQKSSNKVEIKMFLREQSN